MAWNRNADTWFIGFMNGSETMCLFAGDAAREDGLNHFYIGQTPVVPRLCSARPKGAGFFVKKRELEAVRGTGIDSAGGA